METWALLCPEEPVHLPGLQFPACNIPPKPEAECCFGSPSAQARAKPDCGEFQGKGHESIFLISSSKPSWSGKGQPLLLLPGEFLCGGSRENQHVLPCHSIP